MQDYLIAILILLSGFGWLQVSNFWIGNRSYSKIYESYCLIKKNKFTKLIYFKPRHFNRYTLDEVIIFFLSYIFLIWSLVLITLTLGGIFTLKFMLINSIINIGIILILMVVKILFIDITYNIELKWYKNQPPKYTAIELQHMLDKVDEMNTDSFSKKVIKNQIKWDHKYGKSLMIANAYNELIAKNKNNKSKVEKIDEEFIQHYRNYKKIKNISIENNNTVVEYFTNVNNE